MNFLIKRTYKKTSLIFVFCIIFFIFSISIFNINCKSEKINFLYVGGSSQGNYSSIQDAIDNSSDGDTVYIYSGSYFENILINKSINLFGEDKNFVILDSLRQVYSILIKSSNVNISGINVQNSQIGIYIIDHKSGLINIYENIFFENFEGIRIYNSSNITITKNVIHNNSEIGIVSHESKNIEIIENNFFKNFKGVHLGRWSNYLMISKNNFSENKFGLYLYFSSNNSIINNDFFENSYGALLKNSKNNSFTYNDFEKNQVAAISLEYIEDNILEPNIFYDNTENIKVNSKPPKIKAPGFEFLFLIFGIFIILALKKYL